jgi:hypothetical protein
VQLHNKGRECRGRSEVKRQNRTELQAPGCPGQSGWAHEAAARHGGALVSRLSRRRRVLPGYDIGRSGVKRVSEWGLRDRECVRGGAFFTRSCVSFLSLVRV